MRTHLPEKALNFEKDVNIFHTNTMHCVQKTKTTSENVLNKQWKSLAAQQDFQCPESY